MLMHPTSSAAEIKRHIELTECRVLFTCRSLLPTANEVLVASKVQDPRAYLLDLPEELGRKPSLPDQGQQTVEQLISAGATLPLIEALDWAEGQGKEQVAYLCPTSGTSGLQVMLSLNCGSRNPR